MKQNEYDPAEAVEIGKAEDVILGQKMEIPFPDSAGDGTDRLYVS